jgi:hypothetical protein
MPYTAEISAKNPSCFLFLIDQSGSMSGAKAATVAALANRLLYTLVLRCAKGDGVRDFYHVGLLGYGQRVAPLLSGPLAGRTLVPISAVGANPLRVDTRVQRMDDGAGGLVDHTVSFPVWLDPTDGAGPTPFCAALNLAWETLADFLVRYPACFPPVVFNLTDGEATDGDPEPKAARLRDLASEDGPVLLFNLLLAYNNDKPVEFPDREADLPDEYGRMLFRMSSPLPPLLRATARDNGFPATEATRGLVYNADAPALVRFLDVTTVVDIGTRINPRMV